MHLGMRNRSDLEAGLIRSSDWLSRSVNEMSSYRTFLPNPAYAILPFIPLTTLYAGSVDRSVPLGFGLRM